MKRLLIYLFFLLSTVFVSNANMISLYLENDIRFDRDDYYTHGTKLSYSQNNWDYSLGQNMYTPKNKETLTPVPGDRPYAGWLYLGIAKSTMINSWEQYLELDLGIVGPESYAYETQKFIHEMIGSGIPKGWDSQVKTEPTALILLQESKSLFYSKYFNLIPFAEGSLGNVISCLGVGINIQAGYNVEQTLHNQVNVKAVKNNKTKRLYAFGGVKGRYVFNNIFLEGNTWKDYDYGVEKEDWVGDLQFGLCAQYGFLKIYFARDYRTKEFETQPSDCKGFESLKLSFEF